MAALAQIQQAEREPAVREDPHLLERFSLIIGRLQKEADHRIGQRANLEQRWICDMEQVHGEYDQQTKKNLADSEKSQLFINLTRAKCNAMEARLSDMLFPTDDKNWGITPTPVPELTDEAQKAADQAIQLKVQAEQAAQQGDPRQPGMAQQAALAEQVASKLKAQIDEATKRCAAMSDEIEDQLRECRHHISARDVIRDAVRIGTGVMKGPVLDDGRRRTAWDKVASGGPGGAEVYQMRPRAATKPSFVRVDPWHFFPDMDATCIEDSESEFERHVWTKKALRRLARQPGFDKLAIARVIEDTPRPQSQMQHITELRAITGNHIDATAELYVGWEYRGPLTYQDMIDLAAASGDEELARELEGEGEDPLFEVQATVWFCQDQLLKLGIHPLDSGESLYSVFCLEKDESSIFGYGLPYIMRDQQRAMNSAWRMMMDNSGFSAGPQIVLDKMLVTPANGKWDLKGPKIWFRTGNPPTGHRAFETFDIPSHQAEMANIIALAREFIDDETSIPKIAIGDGASQVQQTAQGMTILQNAVNIVFRRVVKNFDDDMTTPCIARLYDWNMQFSEKEHIKGDFEVDARGTSVLLVRELQSQNLMMMLGAFAGHPVLGPLIKAPAACRRLVQSMLLPADEIVMTDDELKQQAAQQQPAPDPEMLKLEAEMNIVRIESQTKLQIAQMDRDTAMMQMSAKMNLTLDQIRAQLAAKQADRDSDERIFAAEAALEERKAAQGDQSGSGGFLS